METGLGASLASPGDSAEGKYSVAPGSALEASRILAQVSAPLEAATMSGNSCPGSRKWGFAWYCSSNSTTCASFLRMATSSVDRGGAP